MQHFISLVDWILRRRQQRRAQQMPSPCPPRTPIKIAQIRRIRFTKHFGSLEGFNFSKDGLLGAGVYVTTDESKAKAFAGNDGHVLRVAANLGRVQTVDARAARKHGFSETGWHKTHDTAYVPQGEGVARPEHCVKDPARVIPLRVHK
eukprot:symbB.v1.2.013730.t1/scaffold977.1/size148281/13